MNVGFIGLGIMGKPMARNLLRAGYKVYAYDIVGSSVDCVAQDGAVACSTVGEVCRACTTLITMLPNGPEVRSVVMNPGGIYDSAAPGTLLIDMSSIAPGVSKELNAALAQKGIHMLDAPVSGGEPKAVDGTLAIMVGGEQEDYDRALPLFQVLGSSYQLIGGPGSGNTCKLTNQIIVAVNIAALGEGMMLAKMAGADPEKVFEGIRGGLAGSAVMEAKAPMMLSGNFAPGFRIDLHVKDLNNALETGHLFHAPLPLTEMVQEVLKKLSAQGEGNCDHSALVKYYEEWTGVSLAQNQTKNINTERKA